MCAAGGGERCLVLVTRYRGMNRRAQALYGEAVAELLRLTAERTPSPNDKLVRNLASMACGDAAEVPSCAAAAAADAAAAAPAAATALTAGPALGPAAEAKAPSLQPFFLKGGAAAQQQQVRRGASCAGLVEHERIAS